MARSHHSRLTSIHKVTSSSRIAVSQDVVCESGHCGAKQTAEGKSLKDELCFSTSLLLRIASGLATGEEKLYIKTIY